MVDKFCPLGTKFMEKNKLFEKKVPKRKMFQNTESKINTGMTVKNIETISDHTIVKRKSEIFKRIKPSTLSKLLDQEYNQESIYNLNNNKDTQYDNFDNVSTVNQDQKEDMRSQISNMTVKTEQLGLNENTNFVLLDLRSAQEYAKFHIKESISFPAILINQDKLLAIIYAYKNQPNKLIITYGFDEKDGIVPTTLLCEKGINNIYLMNGGIEQFGIEYTNYIEGEISSEILKQKEKKATEKKIYKRSDKENHVDFNFKKKQQDLSLKTQK